MKLKTLEQFESKDPCECGGNCNCGGNKSLNEKFSFSKKEVEDASNLIAAAIAKADKVKTKVHHLEYDKGRGAGFDISIDGEESAGGSYVVKDNGDVVNAAIGNSHPNAVYSTIGNKDIADVFTNMKKYESVVTEAKMEKEFAAIAKQVKKHNLLMKISNDLFPEIAKEQKDGVFVNFRPLSQEQIDQVFDELVKRLKLEESMNEASFDSEELYSEIEKDRKTKMISDIEDGSILFYHKDIAKGKAEVNVDGWSGDITIEVPGGPYGSGEWYGDQVSNMKDIDKQIKSYIKAEKSGEFEAMEESAVTEAKKYKFKELAKAWEFVYGEEMEDEYEGFYQEVVGKYKNKVTKADIAEIWNNVYGEDIATEYDGFFGSIKENLNTALKLDKLFEANPDGTISDDEDERRAELLERVKEQMQELLASAEFDAKDIGGSFRSPGIMAEIKKELTSQLKKFR